MKLSDMDLLERLRKSTKVKLLNSLSLGTIYQSLSSFRFVGDNIPRMLRAYLGTHLGVITEFFSVRK